MAHPNPDIQNIHDFLREQSRLILRTRQKVYALEAQEKLRRAGREAKLPVEFKAQHGEDLLMWELFDKQLDGFFIEAGAFDGYHYSVTYCLEAVGWTGLLVEPLAQRAKLCAQRRAHSRVVNAALGREASGTITFNVVEDMYGGMLSHVRGMGQTADRPETKTQSVQVPLTNLNTLLAEHNGPIDLLVLDVEAAEFEVLAGFDINRFGPRIMMIETDPQRDSARLKQYMAGFPYRYIGNVENNELFLRADQTEIRERIRWANL